MNDSYGVYEVYTWDKVYYKKLFESDSKAEADHVKDQYKQESDNEFKPSDYVKRNPKTYIVMTKEQFEIVNI